MRRKAAGIVLILVTAVMVSGLAFADTSQGRKLPDAAGEVNFTAELSFDGAMDDYVELDLANYGQQPMKVMPEAHYMDHLGTAGSWDCKAEAPAVIGAGRSKRIGFLLPQAVSHGENSILAFFFQYNGSWYLGKVGETNGVEYFLEHN